MGMVGCFAAVDIETMQRLVEDPEQVEEYLYPDDGEGEPPHYADVDKAWHGIHYLLTGKADDAPDPLGSAILGGDELGEDVGYGPARLLNADQVRSIASALPDEETFKSRFAPREMTKAEVYPVVIWERDGDEALEYLVENYKSLVEFYQGAAARGQGAILWLA
ncbi:YfbM family protein [Lysobacter korlensis]|uniref:YfbM family protein n=1 Tax=Lysobacter korlensis TaxID=553636 RepID=A0ABV6S0X3_9GAMM